MPLNIVNSELYADRTGQNWHRTVFPANFDAIDVDLLGSCHRGYCREPLYLVEFTTNPDKPVSIMTRLAQKANVAALVVEHDCNVVLRGRQVWPVNLALNSDVAVREHIYEIRQDHERQHNGA